MTRHALTAGCALTPLTTPNYATTLTLATHGRQRSTPVRHDTITLLQNTRVSAPVWYDPPAYQYLAPAGRLRSRVSRWCWNLLNKWGCILDATYERYVTETVTFNPSNVIESILKQRMECMRDWDTMPTQIILGDEDFAQFRMEAGRTGLMQFTMDGHGRQEFNGMRIVVVPWMRGVVVVP